jgi:ELWxxDGT repeat protein
MYQRDIKTLYMKKSSSRISILFAFGAFISHSIYGQQLVKDVLPGSNSSTISNFTSCNGDLYFFAQDQSMIFGQKELWKSDGTEAGTVLVKDINPVYGGISFSGYTKMVCLNGKVLFAGNDNVNGTELWTSDGTEAGTYMLKDIRIGNSSMPRKFLVVNNLAFFIADDGINGPELWKSDGTTAGTQLVKDILPGEYGESGFNNSEFVEMGGLLYFESRQATNGHAQLWKSDGTESGTTLVKDLPAYVFKYLTVVNGKIFFSAIDNNLGNEMFVSDGTEAGTMMVKDILPGNFDSAPTYLQAFNNEVYFLASTPQFGREVWKSDGTEAGTVMLKDINAGSGGIVYNVDNAFAVLNNELFFVAFESVNGSELWKTNGTEAGTQLVKNIMPGANPAFDFLYATELGVINGVLYFLADNGINGGELWKSDGTTAGTQLVMDIKPGGVNSTSGANNFYNYNNTLFFTANDGIHGSELWKNTNSTNSTGSVKVQNSISLHPNPADKTIILTIANIRKNESFRVLNSLGQSVVSGVLNASQSSINIEDLTAGIYFIQFNNPEFPALKFIKNK